MVDIPYFKDNIYQYDAKIYKAGVDVTGDITRFNLKFREGIVDDSIFTRVYNNQNSVPMPILTVVYA